MTRAKIKATLSGLRAGDACMVAGWRVEAFRDLEGRRAFRAYRHGDGLPGATGRAVISGPRKYVVEALASRVGETLERGPRKRA